MATFMATTSPSLALDTSGRHPEVETLRFGQQSNYLAYNEALDDTQRLNRRLPVLLYSANQNKKWAVLPTGDNVTVTWQGSSYSLSPSYKMSSATEVHTGTTMHDEQNKIGTCQHQTPFLSMVSVDPDIPVETTNNTMIANAQAQISGVGKRALLEARQFCVYQDEMSVIIPRRNTHDSFQFPKEHVFAFPVNDNVELNQTDVGALVSPYNGNWREPRLEESGIFVGLQSMGDKGLFCLILYLPPTISVFAELAQCDLKVMLPKVNPGYVMARPLPAPAIVAPLVPHVSSDAASGTSTPKAESESLDSGYKTVEPKNNS